MEEIGCFYRLQTTLNRPVTAHATEVAGLLHHLLDYVTSFIIPLDTCVGGQQTQKISKQFLRVRCWLNTLLARERSARGGFSSHHGAWDLTTASSDVHIRAREASSRYHFSCFKKFPFGFNNLMTAGSMFTL